MIHKFRRVLASKLGGLKIKELCANRHISTITLDNVSQVYPQIYNKKQARDSPCLFEACLPIWFTIKMQTILFGSVRVPVSLGHWVAAQTWLSRLLQISRQMELPR